MLKQLTILSLLIMLSGGARALTLGQIHVYSYINQPLKATIDLQGVKADDLTALKVKLASRAEFKNTGVDWSAQLEGLSFSIIQSNKGPAIRVTSRKPVVEPFLSFVVDAKWANGKMTKDFTLLLDPPLYSGKKAAEVDVAEAASVADDKPVQSDDIKPQPRSVLPTPPEEEAVATSPASDTQGSAAQTMTGASLWQVASKVRPANATMQQTMVAIHEENQESFLRGNMNLLKKGQLLRIPSAKVIQGISGSAAVKRVAKHERALRARKSIKSSKRLSPEIIELAAEPAPAENLAQQTADATLPEAESGGRLRLDSAADAVNADAMGGDPVSGEAEISSKTSGSEENKALRSRVALLEEQLKVAHKLIRMKGELAQLQQLYRQIDTQRPQADEDQLEVTDEQLLLLADAESVAAEKTVAGETGQEPLSAEVANTKDEALVAEYPEQQASTDTDKSEDVESSRSDADQLSPVAGDEDSVAGEQTQVEDVASSPPPAEEENTGNLTAETETVASRGEDAAPSAESLHGEADVAPDDKPDSLIDGIENNLLFTVGGVGTLGLMLAFLLGRRGGKKSTGPDQSLSGEIPLDESMTETKLAGESSSAVQESRVENVREVFDVGETPIQQPDEETTRLFEPPEVLSIEEPVALDPLELVKVLIRNGENQQAQEVLVQAVEVEPARMELHMQLIELLHANKDRHAFEAEMNQLETSGFNIEPGDWQKIERMHADLLPAAVDSPDVVSRRHSEAEIIDLDFGAAEFSSSDEKVAGNHPDSDLEDALRAFEMVLEDKKSDEFLPEAGIALDETSKIPDNPVTNVMPGAEIVEDLELEEDLVVDQNAVTDEGVDVISLDDSFGIDSHINSDFADVITASADQRKEQSDTFPNGGEETLPVAESEELSITSFDADPTTLKKAELDAKIDLAAAFADMGDVDGAKDILDEIMSEGTERQQQAAQEMLKKYL